MSVKYCFPVPVFHFWSKLMHPTVWSFCDSWASCLYSISNLLSTRFYIVYAFVLVLKSLIKTLASAREKFILLTTISRSCTVFWFCHGKELCWRVSPRLSCRPVETALRRFLSAALLTLSLTNITLSLFLFLLFCWLHTCMRVFGSPLKRQVTTKCGSFVHQCRYYNIII